jgi:hypothetical protein
MDVFMAVRPSALTSPFAPEATCGAGVPQQECDLQSNIFTGSPQSHSLLLQNSTNPIVHPVTVPEMFTVIAGLNHSQARTILAAFRVINPLIQQQVVAALEHQVEQTKANQT